MYKNFFGFKERPFQLVPNPAYLYLSKCHEEAMAHLLYAVSQGDGFVVITGEVGTGKTTLCRAFLENLDRETEAAYIFNPTLGSLQLLKAINDEFGIPSDADNPKDLIDTLNSYLMGKKARGERVLLIIDEAQNLTREVLEQLRLLSNLETTTSKLLQIILTGQPELGEMLDSYELRQLGQRVTLRCHLFPLTCRETRTYIQHRIQIASRRPGVHFSEGAVRCIFRFSGGIPRLINIACDRALLTAFGLDQQKVTTGVAESAIRELTVRRDHRRSSGYALRRVSLLAGAFAGVGLLAGIFYHSGILSLYQPDPTRGPAVSEAVGVSEIQRPLQASPPVGAKTEPPAEVTVFSDGTTPSLEDPPIRAAEKGSHPVFETEPDRFLLSLGANLTRNAAMVEVLDIWGLSEEVEGVGPAVEDDAFYFQLAAGRSAMLSQRIAGDLDMLKRLNLPAILELKLPDSSVSRYAALTEINDHGVVLRGKGFERGLEIDRNKLAHYWTGISYIPWKDFYGIMGDVSSRSSRESILTLKMLLKDIGFTNLDMRAVYDGKAREAVKEIQSLHGIPADGIVGPLTKIVLYNQADSLKTPRICRPETENQKLETRNP